MSSVILSSQDSGVCREIGLATAAKLGRRGLGVEILGEASRLFGLGEESLRKALEASLSFFGMSPAASRRHLPAIQAVLARRLVEDDLVYYGPFGHLLLRRVPHVCQIRLNIPMEERARREAERTGLPAGRAIRRLEAADRRRRQWVARVFKMDEDDERLYDLLLDPSRLGMEGAVKAIGERISSPDVKPTTYSRKRLEELATEYDVRARLVDLDPEVRVEVREGKVVVQARATRKGGQQAAELLRQRALEAWKVGEVTVQLRGDLFGDIAGTPR